MKNCINSLELFACFALWTVTVFYALFDLYFAQTEILSSNQDALNSLTALRPGWKLVSRLWDTSDIEWNSWKYLIKALWLHLVINFIISEIIRNTLKPLLKPWFILSSVIAISLRMGIWQLLIVITQPMIFLATVMCGGGKIMIWILNIFFLQCYNSVKYMDLFWEMFDHENLHDEEIYLMLIAVPWIDLRCNSFCIDYIDKKEKLKMVDNKDWRTIYNSFIEMFSYVLYLPVLYTGPMILYEDFEKSTTLQSEKLLQRLKYFVWNIFLFIIYTILVELSFHYIYFYAMQSNIQLMRKFNLLALSGGGLWMGLEFHAKYVISYGVTAAFAHLDNIDAPPTPRCIARIHIYSDIWRYFDVGLYKYLVKYIYRPIMVGTSKFASLPKVCVKLFAVFVTFVFTFMWHGPTLPIFTWASLNYIIMSIENITKIFTKTDTYLSFKRRYLKTEQMEMRFTAISCTPLLILSAMSNFYLFAEIEVANLYFEHLLQISLWKFFILLIVFYCCCIVSITLKDIPSRTDFKRRIKYNK